MASLAQAHQVYIPLGSRLLAHGDCISSNHGLAGLELFPVDSLAVLALSDQLHHRHG